MSNLFSGHETALKRHGYDDTSGGIIKKLYSHPNPMFLSPQFRIHASLCSPREERSMEGRNFARR